MATSFKGEGEGGLWDWWQNALFLTEILGKPPILNSEVISNLNIIERAPELKQYSPATQCMLFCRKTIHLTINARKGGGEQKDDMMTRGREGVWIPSKNDDVVYEQALILTFSNSFSKPNM